MTRTVALYVGCALYDSMTVVCGVWLKIKDQICSFIPHIGLLPYNFMCERFDLVYCSLSVLRFVLMSILVHAHVTGSHSSYLWLGFDLRFFQFCFSSPVNMVDSYENRFAFACAFGATTTKCLSILFFGSYEEIFSPEFNEWIQSPAVPSFTGSKPTII